MPYATVNPFTGATIKTFPDATDTEVQQAIAAAHDAFSRWKGTSFETRAAVVLQNENSA